MRKKVLFKNQKNTDQNKRGAFCNVSMKKILEMCLVLLFCIYGEPFCVAKSANSVGSSGGGGQKTQANNINGSPTTGGNEKTNDGGGKINAGGGNDNYNNANPIQNEKPSDLQPNNNGSGNEKPYANNDPGTNKPNLEIEADDVIIHATPKSNSLTEPTYTYSPGIFKNKKVQTGIIDFNFYYYSANGSGGRWMARLAKLYDGRPEKQVKTDYILGRDDGKVVMVPYPSIEAIEGLRRGITPSAMVDSEGNLYTLSLVGFGQYGPKFQLAKYCYSENNKTINSTTATFEPWRTVYNIELPKEPNFTINNSEDAYHWRFHNALSPCIFQEVGGKYNDTFIRIFCLIPNQYLITGKGGGFEGGLFLKLSKEELSKFSDLTDPGNTQNPPAFQEYSSTGEEFFEWCRAPNRSYGSSSCFQNCWGNYQGLIFDYPGNKSWYNWLFFVSKGTNANKVSSGNGNSKTNESNQSSCYVYCKKVWSAGFSAQGNTNALPEPEGETEDTGRYICPRFIRTQNHVYYAFSHKGTNIVFGRMEGMNTGNETSNLLGTLDVNCGIESNFEGSSYSAYNFDFCVLNKDGSPCTHESKDEGAKIICVFSLGGGSYTGMTQTTTYINWITNYATGVLSSICLSENSRSTWAQNTIYVTGLQRGLGECVSIINTAKPDANRLYLNSQKIVPYTSPTGKHYMIYAYCYPGKKEHLYLGYAQYFIDSQGCLRLLSQTEFKDGDPKNGDGPTYDSFGDFTRCSRIISMDLKNNHLWITFVKDTGWDATEQSQEVRQKAGCYYYFHILASDLIQE